MTKFLTLIFAALLFAGSASAAATAMDEFAAQYSSGSFSLEYVPQGYTAAQVPRLQWSPALIAKLNALEEDRIESWTTYVAEGGEYDHLSPEERERIKKDPQSFFNSKYVTQVDEQFEISKDGKVIGYILNVHDPVMSTIYQDSAGIVIYLDDKMNVVSVNEWAA